MRRGKEMYGAEADYVVVGGGSSGATIAARLAQSGASVIVLEAGGSDEQLLVRVPGGVGPMSAVPQLKKRNDWGYVTVPQVGALGRRMPQPRGKVLGGSGSVNAMLYVRGNRADYDSWAAEGATGWDADACNTAFRRFEDFEDGDNAWRGVGGPIKVTRNPAPQEATLQFLAAAAETTGCKVLEDYNGAEQEGVSLAQQNAAGGLRYSAARGYVHHLAPPGLEVQTRVHAERIVIAHGRAVGVGVRDQGGTRRTIRAHQEVILSGGFVGSPQLLMLSGIGPAAHLAEHGIDVVADLPVGENLHDHLFHALTFHVDSSTLTSKPLGYALGFARELCRPGSTFLANGLFEAVAFLRTSLATESRPDLQLQMMPWSYVKAQNQDSQKFPGADPRTAVTLLATLIHPRSRGTLRLASADPATAPLIDPRYLTEPADLDLLVEGSELSREIMRAGAFGRHVKEEIFPGAEMVRDGLRQGILNRATPVFHGVGTCRMGTDEHAVVAPDLRVRGIDGLRVCDASVMPSITSGNTNAPSIMIGERGADLVLATT